MSSKNARKILQILALAVVCASPIVSQGYAIPTGNTCQPSDEGKPATCQNQGTTNTFSCTCKKNAQGQFHWE